MQVVSKCFYMYEIVHSCKNSTINSKKSLQIARFLYFALELVAEKYKDVQKIFFHNFY
jgi:hypothetical protein